MRFLFLDFDGVMVPFAKSEDYIKVCEEIVPGGVLQFDANCVAELNMICSAGRASIVISSSWQYYIKDLDKIRAMLQAQGVNAAVSGMTMQTATNEDQSRAKDIHDFVSLWKGDELESFVILDDTNLGFAHEGYHDQWVRTHPHNGITRPDAERAIAILTKS